MIPRIPLGVVTALVVVAIGWFAFHGRDAIPYAAGVMTTALLVIVFEKLEEREDW